MIRAVPILVHALLWIFLGTVVAQAQDDVPGVSAKSIVFGQTAAFSGPSGALGKDLRLGIEAAFNEANIKGGVHGRQIYLIYHDDRFEPDRAIINTRKLINQESVFALIGSVGTTTSLSVAPIASSAGVPFVAPLTGSEILRQGNHDNLINMRASFGLEIETIVELLVDKKGIEGVAVLYEDDSLGREGYAAARKALSARNLEPVATGVYPRNTTAIKSSFYDLRKAKPEAIILIGTYKPVGNFIMWARYLDFEPVFATISISGNNSLAREIGESGEGVYATQVVPNYLSQSLPAARQYRAALDTLWAGTPYGLVSFEGYLAGRMTIAALDKCGLEVDRQCFLNVFLSSEEIDIDGFKLFFGEVGHQGSDSVFLTVIKSDGSFEYLEESAEVRQ